MSPVQEPLSQSQSAQFYFWMQQRKKMCQHDADPATHGALGGCWGLKGRELQWVGPVIFHLGCDPGPAMPNSRGLPRQACSAPLLWVPGFWVLVLETRLGSCCGCTPLPEEVTEAPGWGKLYPWVPLGLVGSRNNMQMAFFEARAWKAFKASDWSMLGF